jgi:hypothetical protein
MSNHHSLPVELMTYLAEEHNIRCYFHMCEMYFNSTTARGIQQKFPKTVYDNLMNSRTFTQNFYYQVYLEKTQLAKDFVQQCKEKEVIEMIAEYPMLIHDLTDNFLRSNNPNLIQFFLTYPDRRKVRVHVYYIYISEHANPSPSYSS